MEVQSPFRVITTSVDGDVLQVLASTEGEFTVGQLSRLITHRSTAGIRLATERLAEQGIVVRRVAGRTQTYSLNEEHLLAQAIRAIAGAKTMLLDRLRTLFADEDVAYAALFGSAASGDMRPDSDLDLFVVREDNAASDDRLMRLALTVTRLTGNDARIVDLSATDVGDSHYGPLIDEVLAAGITLAGDRRILTKARRGSAR